jgi:hypothetical protein
MSRYRRESLGRSSRRHRGKISERIKGSMNSNSVGPGDWEATTDSFIWDEWIDRLWSAGRRGLVLRSELPAEDVDRSGLFHSILAKSVFVKVLEESKW